MSDEQRAALLLSTALTALVSLVCAALWWVWPPAVPIVLLGLFWRYEYVAARKVSRDVLGRRRSAV